MKRTALFAVAALALAVGACSDDPLAGPRERGSGTEAPATGPPVAQPPAPTEDITEPPATTEPPAPLPPESPKPLPEPSDEPTVDAPPTSERGYIVKAVGEPGGLYDMDTGEMLVDFTITSIEPNFTCTGPDAQAPARGHFLAVTMDVTVSELAADFDPGFMAVDPESFRVFNESGSQSPNIIGNSAGCVDPAELLPTEIQPGEQVTGLIIFDVAPTTGVLAWNYANATNLGWEWPF